MTTAPSPRRRVLVVSNETVEADILRDTIVSLAHATEIVVVAPALNTRLRHWTSDDAEQRDRHSGSDGCAYARPRWACAGTPTAMQGAP